MHTLCGLGAAGLDVRPHRQPGHLRQQGQLRQTLATVQHLGKSDNDVTHFLR